MKRLSFSARARAFSHTEMRLLYGFSCFALSSFYFPLALCALLHGESIRGLERIALGREDVALLLVALMLFLILFERDNEGT